SARVVAKRSPSDHDASPMPWGGRSVSVTSSAQQAGPMPPRQLEYRRPGGLHRLRATPKPIDDLAGEGHTGCTGSAPVGNDVPFRVRADQAVKGGIEELAVEHSDGEDVDRKGQRVHAQAQAGHAQLSRLARGA